MSEQREPMSAEAAVLHEVLDGNWDGARERLVSFMPRELTELERACYRLADLCVEQFLARPSGQSEPEFGRCGE